MGVIPSSRPVPGVSSLPLGVTAVLRCSVLLRAVGRGPRWGLSCVVCLLCMASLFTICPASWGAAGHLSPACSASPSLGTVSGLPQNKAQDTSEAWVRPRLCVCPSAPLPQSQAQMGPRLGPCEKGYREQKDGDGPRETQSPALSFPCCSAQLSVAWCPFRDGHRVSGDWPGWGPSGSDLWELCHTQFIVFLQAVHSPPSSFLDINPCTVFRWIHWGTSLFYTIFLWWLWIFFWVWFCTGCMIKKEGLKGGWRKRSRKKRRRKELFQILEAESSMFICTYNMRLWTIRFLYIKIR
jgi:hypothetical protein